MRAAMTNRHICLRLLAYSKASLLLSLEGLTREQLVWQPAPGKGTIGWNAAHVSQFRGALMWCFDPEPRWTELEPLIAFGYGSNPDELRDKLPPKAELIRLIHEDWDLLLQRLAPFTEADYEREVPLNNPDGETLFEALHRVSWHADHHVGRICALRSQLNTPTFPRPVFGARGRRALKEASESRWERIVRAADEL